MSWADKNGAYLQMDTSYFLVGTQNHTDVSCAPTLSYILLLTVLATKSPLKRSKAFLKMDAQ